MEIFNNKDQECFHLQQVTQGKSYKVSFNIDGDFHVRFDVIDNKTQKHSNYLTGTIYSGSGVYNYIFTPPVDGIMCINKSPNRANLWTVINNLSIEELSI